jgi:endoglucanase
MRRATASSFALTVFGAGCGAGYAGGAQPDAATSASDAGGEQGSSGRDANGADAGSADAGDDTPSLQGLHVQGATLVDHGKVVRLLGVDHAGSEWSCVGGGGNISGKNGFGFFDGPADDSLVTPMLAWKINAVRLPLNEECWLGINGVNPTYSGKNYRDAVAALVSMIRSHGLYVILDLHWSAPGTSIGTTQQPMAGADHAVDFWSSVAATFAAEQGVVFDLFNEPYLDSGNVTGGVDPWECLQNGCTAQLQSPLTGTYKTAGMQSLLDAIRKAGAGNVVMVSGLAYTSDLSGWAAHEPTDPAGNLAASLHLYNFNGCTDATCWNKRYAALAKAVPIVTGENGENDCAHGFVDAYMNWADGLGVSYLGWSWNVEDCANFPALITDWKGTPSGFGAGLMKHLQAM